MHNEEQNKQIEEMAKDIYGTGQCYDTYWQSHCENLATDLYNAGYRKSTDVAEEIFAEIEKTFKECLWFLENHPSNYPRMDRTKNKCVQR